jgi:transcriptional regulator with XRE-family HTH domain
MDTLDRQLGKNVQKARKVRGISQEELAGSAGIDRSYMSRIERGIVSVSLEKVYVIANTLDCELDELLPKRKNIKA